MKVFGQLILDVLDGSPRADSQGTLAAICVMNILDKYFQVEGCIVGKAVVMTHGVGGSLGDDD